MRREDIQLALEEREADSIIWNLRKRRIDCFGDKDGRLITTTSLSANPVADDSFYQEISLHNTRQIVKVADWSLGIPSKIEPPEAHKRLEERMKTILSRPLSAEPTGLRSALDNSPLNLLLNPIHISPEAPYNHAKMIGRFLGNLAAYLQFEEQFKQLGTWDYSTVQPLVHELIALFSSETSLKKEFDFGDPERVLKQPEELEYTGSA